MEMLLGKEILPFVLFCNGYSVGSVWSECITEFTLLGTLVVIAPGMHRTKEGIRLTTMMRPFRIIIVNEITANRGLLLVMGPTFHLVNNSTL